MADDIKAEPNPGPGISHEFDCTHDPCVCLRDDDPVAESEGFYGPPLPGLLYRR